MQRNIIWLVVFFFALSLMIPAATINQAVAAPFGDVPEDHWAAEAVSQLAAKGLVEGYPDGLYRGDRAASRYEMAMIVSRVMAKLEAFAKHEHEQYVTKKDLEMVKRLMNEFKDELDALGVRVSNAEAAIASLEKRVTELERVRVYGEFKTKWVANSLNYQPDINAAGAVVQPGAASLESGTDHLALSFKSKAGDPFNPGKLYSTIPVSTGTAFTTSGTIGVKGKLAKNIDGGAEISAWSATGDRNVALRHGTRLPYLSNPFTENSGFTATGNLKDDAFNFRGALDNIWVRKDDWKVTLGTYNTDRTKRYFLGGVPNLQFTEPGDFYPLWGAQLKGKWKAGEFPMWGEAYAAKLAEAGGTSGNINTYVWGSRVDMNFNKDKGNLGVNFQRVANTDTNTVGGGVTTTAFINYPRGGSTALAGGLTGNTHIPWTLTGTPFVNMDYTANANVRTVLPQNQEMNMVGVDLTYKFPEVDSKWLKDLWVKGQFGNSSYKPTTVIPLGSPNGSIIPKADGDMWSFLVSANLFKVNFKGEYLNVDPTYDPFLIQMPNPFGPFTGPGTGYTWATISPFNVAFGANTVGVNNAGGFYHVHDTKYYPHNREGFRVGGSWDFEVFKSSANLYSAFESYTQKEASTGANLAKVGFIEPEFTLAGTLATSANNPTGINPGSATKGKIQMWHNGFSYDIPISWLKNKITWYTYHRLRYRHRDTDDANNIDLIQHKWATRFSYPFSKKLTVYAGYGIEERNRANLSRVVTEKWAMSEWAAGLFYNVTNNAQWYIEGSWFFNHHYANPLAAGTTSYAEGGVINPYNASLIHSGFTMKF